MAKTLKFTAVIGYVPGYGHKNEGREGTDPRRVWQSAAKEEFDESGYYVSATAVDGHTVYHEDWGCPVGGERTVVFSGSANPEFTANMDEWRESVIRVAKESKRSLEQTTVVIEFAKVDHVYLT